MKADQNTIDSLNDSIQVFVYRNLQDITRANKVLKEEFEAEINKLKVTFEAKEVAFKAERDLLIKGCQEEVNIEDMNVLTTTKNIANKNKDKMDDKGDSTFVKRELEDYKKRYTDIIKENSLLRNQIIGLTGENEKLSKSTITLTRKMDDLASKLKKAEPKPIRSIAGLSTPKILSLNEQRLNKKRKQINEKFTQKDLESKNNVNSSTYISSKLSSKRSSQNIETKEISIIKNGNIETQHLSISRLHNELSFMSETSNETMILPLNEMTDNKNSLAPYRTKSPFDENLNYTKVIKERSNFVTMSSKMKMNILKESMSSVNSGISPQVLTESNKWKCVYKEEQHSFGIFSLAAFEHYLISSSNVLKLWDVNKKQTLAEIPVTNPKVLYVSDKLLISASEKQGSVAFYNLPSLEIVHTIDTGLDAVRAIHVNNNVVFLGGSGNVGALQLWDLNTMTKLCDKERGQDIFSILRKNSVIYYGGRNRCINRVNFDTMVVLL